MGTDIYLSWDGMTEEEKKAQVTGWRIDAGKVGYLRASIGMVRENEALSLIFPDRYWEGNTLAYDFKANLNNIFRILLSYAQNKTFLVDAEHLEDQKKMADTVFSALKAGFKDAKIGMGSSDKPSKKWAKSVMEFATLGLEKQERGKNPKVSISW